MDYPSVFMTISDYYLQESSRQEKQKLGREDDENDDTNEEMEVDMDYSVSVALQFEQLTTELETTKETPQPPSPFELATDFVKGRRGPERKLRLEQELLLT
ncbi:hypothetical protein P5673_012447 [Acropora cervicornis]|uniref:Uncharacterized protein n=1 Tax=Acropora cervicornis TaxID=6130 RepID=A0AAD9QMU6_ACRCE|nr:hypothetical protein P5673_012447 [Acropora cervicornis]